MCNNNKDVMDEFLIRTEEALCQNDLSISREKVNKAIAELDKKRRKLVELRLDEMIDRETYDIKYNELDKQAQSFAAQRDEIQGVSNRNKDIKQRIADFRSILEKNEVLNVFDRHVFESIVEKVIVGGVDKDGKPDPSMLTFIYKTGFKNAINGDRFKPIRKNGKRNRQADELCTNASIGALELCPHFEPDTCGVRGVDGARFFGPRVDVGDSGRFVKGRL